MQGDVLYASGWMITRNGAVTPKRSRDENHNRCIEAGDQRIAEKDHVQGEHGKVGDGPVDGLRPDSGEGFDGLGR